jgi:hypothetical protein
MSAARIAYRIGRYSGLRALRNRRRAASLELPGSALAWHGRTLKIPLFGDMQIQLHPRLNPPGQPAARRFFMLSARLNTPNISRWRYAYLLHTSHFGYGHMELACYEEDGRWAVYGLRNMAADTAHSLGWARTARALGTSAGLTDASFLGYVLTALQDSGLEARLLPAAECVQLSVTPELIAQAHRAERTQALVRRYEGLHQELAR